MISFAHTSPGHAQPVSPFHRFEREALCAVFEDSFDQLAVLGGIMVSSYAERPSAVDVVSLFNNLPECYVKESAGGAVRWILRQRAVEFLFLVLKVREWLGKGIWISSTSNSVYY